MTKIYDLKDFEDFSEDWLFLLELKNTFGILLLILGGTFASSLPFFLGNFSWLVVVPFWLSGSWIILRLNLAPPVLSQSEKEDLKWEGMLKGGYDG